MATQIRLIQQQVADLALVRDLGTEKIKKILEYLPDLKSAQPHPEVLLKHFTKALDGDSATAARLCRAVLALSQLMRQRELDADGLREGLRLAIITTEPTWKDEEITAWEAVGLSFGELCQSKFVRTVSKALELAYEHANLFLGARIVTDIRPVFSNGDDKEMQIDAAVVAFTLRLHYDNREGNHSLSIALDEEDVRTVKEQCERALRKSQTARSRMEEMARVPTIISGEAHDGSDKK